MKTNRTTILIIIFLNVFISSCKKDSIDSKPKSSEKELISFSFLKANNPSLISDIIGTISNNKIYLIIPPGVSKTLTATFSCSALSKVYIDANEQQSNVTINDFSKSIDYKVVAEDGSSTDYFIAINFTKSSQKELLSFNFLKSVNPSLPNDINATISNNKVFIIVPPGVSNNLIATYSISAASNAYIGTIEQQSSKTTNDFSKEVDYKIIAEDGSFSDYLIDVKFTKSSQKELLSFTFLKSINPTLPSDITGSITSGKVSVIVPPGTTLNLIPTFIQSDKSHVFVGALEQQSSITQNTFSNVVNYRVVAEDSSSVVYQVSVTSDSFTDLDNAIKDVMNQNNIPGLSIAIVKNEKLVFLNTYGYADKENMITVKPYSLFRIASVSKPITAIAVLKLFQDGKITSLDSKVFGVNGILSDYGSPPAGSKIDQITIRHLLDHTSGWTNDPNDIMFSTTSTDFKEIIKYVVENRQLNSDPGIQYNYLNFGYCVLGRIIEKISGITYEQYVRKAILQPCGIINMRIGGQALADKLPDEVKYYNSTINPYWLNIPLYDSFGGWVASPTDLMKLMIRIDRENYRPDILTSATLSQEYFGSSNWVHYGQFQGLSSAISRIDDNFSVAFIENHDIGTDNFKLLDKIKQLILSRQLWPSYDLF